MTVDTVERAETEAPQTPPGRRSYGTWVTGIILVLVGALWMLDVAGVIDLRAAVILPAALTILGLALIVGAWDGPHAGLVVLGVFLTLAVVAAAAAPPNAFRGGIGERSFVVDDQGDLAARYDVGIGGLRLDMRDLVLTESAAVDVTVGAGEMTLLLPDDLEVSVDASVGAGGITLPDGERIDGVSVTRTYTSEGYDTAEATLSFELDVAAGEIEVRR
ncbi:MAG: LiaF domain-containing protein [Actinomycetota bacterium]